MITICEIADHTHIIYVNVQLSGLLDESESTSDLSVLFFGLGLFAG